ncbi:hypothetical protein GTA08_BOTSDO11579 [Neofusicoccum parvum]|uniref:Uncharacterized protein n=1 Tax=Neofusicoccum parvum TaxID=310453 RepID=A0ACB5RVA4_9PEZI|nr:hypothetical protein GTA08_BOTSDO11579 [Neofusicoccum parvum]
MEFRFFDKPGQWMPDGALAVLRKTLLRIAATSLHPVPDYQCLGSQQNSLDDKLIVVAYDGEGRAVAFTSTFFLDIPSVPEPVLHSGLTVVEAAHRRGSLVMRMFAHLAANVFPRCPKGVWVVCLAEVPSSLGHVTQYLEDVFPSPEASRPSHSHVLIAREISQSFRPELLICPDAQFDEQKFVFRGSNDWDAGACFKKDPNDRQYQHRDPEWNAFFRDLLRPGGGDEVLQIGFCSEERAATLVKLLSSHHHRSTTNPKL